MQIQDNWEPGTRVSKTVSVMNGRGDLTHGRTFGKVKAHAERTGVYLVMWDDGTQRIERAEDLRRETWSLAKANEKQATNGPA